MGASHRLAALRERGCRIAVRNFGAGALGAFRTIGIDYASIAAVSQDQAVVLDAT